MEPGREGGEATTPASGYSISPIGGRSFYRANESRNTGGIKDVNGDISKKKEGGKKKPKRTLIQAQARRAGQSGGGGGTSRKTRSPTEWMITDTHGG